MRKYCLVEMIALLFVCVACGKEEKAMKEETVNAVLPAETNEVTVMKLEETDFHHELISNGKLEARRQADMRFETAEPIAHIYVKNGERVRKGERIASLASFRLENQRASALDALEKAKLELQDVLIGQGYMLKDSARVPADVLRLAQIQSGYEQARTTYELADYEWRRATLTAPFEGIIANLTQKEYNVASTSEAFCTLIDPQSMEARFTILENELPLIREGDRVVVYPFAASEEKVNGHITEINPRVDENGMIQVKAAIEGTNRLFDGMNVQVSVHRSLGKQLVVPKEAVVLRSGKQVVFTLVDNKANWVYVHTGLENATSYTITDGLKAGDVVITSGNINLAHEAPVRLIEK